MKFTTERIAFLSIALCVSAAAQSVSPDSRKYLNGEALCIQSIKAANWKTAETACRQALDLSLMLPRKFQREKMAALENYAFSLFSQSKFRSALINFEKALKVGSTFLGRSSPDLAKAYFNVGRANQGMASITGSYIVPAERNYLQAETIYRAAYAVADDDAARSTIRDSIRRTLILLRMIATMRGDDLKFRAIKERLTQLDSIKSQEKLVVPELCSPDGSDLF